MPPAQQDRLKLYTIPKMSYSNLFVGMFTRQFANTKLLIDFENRQGHQDFCAYLKLRVDQMYNKYRKEGLIPDVIDL